MGKITKDTPLAELTLRRYEPPAQKSKRGLVRKLCLSLGLLQPGDSRDVVVDVLYVLLVAQRERNMLTSEDVRNHVIAFREENGLDDTGTASSNIRRQLKRLRDHFLVEKVAHEYRMNEFAGLSNIYNQKIEKFLLDSITTRVSEYCAKVEEVFEP